MSTATKGRAAEWFVRDRYLSEGWRVIRAASSKGDADLVATRPTIRDLHYISVKVNSWPTAQERAALTLLSSECAMGDPALGCVGPWRVIVYRKDDRSGWRARLVLPNAVIERPAWGSGYDFSIQSLLSWYDRSK